MGEKVHDISKIFFEKMGIHIEKISVTQEKQDIFFIKILSDDSELIIGDRGRQLHDIQKVLGIILSHHLSTKIIIQVEVNDYLADKDSQLFNLIDDNIQLCLKEDREIRLSFFSPYQRKKIHNYIADKNLENIGTKSEGEGKERRLIICKKSKKMTIDMYGTEI